jgi:hypothetical protein
MYNTWRHDVLYCLYEQEERAKLVGEVESSQADRRNLGDQLDTCLKEMGALDQRHKKEMSFHKVNQSAFSPFQKRIICFHVPILKEIFTVLRINIMNKVL